MSAELLRICRRSLAEAELACGLIENPGRNGPYGRLSTGQSLPKAIRPSTAIGLLRHLLGSPDGAVQSAAIRCVSSRFAAEFEPDLESMWRRGISAECTAAFAAALAEYPATSAVWGPRLVTLIESPDGPTSGEALGSLSIWAAGGDVKRDELIRWLATLDAASPGEAPRQVGPWLQHRIVRTSDYDERHLKTLCTLATTDEQETTAILLEVLERHRFDTYRTRAAAVLEGRDVAPDRAHELLIIIFDGETSGYLRHCTMEALAPNLRDDTRLRALTLRAMDDSYSNVRMYGVELAAVAPPDAEIDARLAALADQIPESVGLRAARALQERASRAPAANDPGAP
jgi:hypothetical protein